MNNKKTKEKSLVQKKKNLLFMLLVLTLISVILCVSSFGIATWARYRTIIGGNVEAQIARWSFKVNGEEEQFADINLAETINFKNVAVNKVAPGTYGSFDLDIDGRGSEVSLDYYINIAVIGKPTNLKFYSDAGYTQEIQLAVNNKFFMEGDLLLTETMEEIRTIYWKWDYTTSEMPDALLLNQYSTEVPEIIDLANEYNNPETSAQRKTELATKINDKIDTCDEGGEVLLEVKVKGVQINPNFTLRKVEVTSGKNNVYQEGDTVDFSMEFTQNVYGDDNHTAVDSTTAPQVTVGFGTTTASNPVAKVASLESAQIKLSEGENLATFVSSSGTKINYTYTLKATDIGDFKIANITGQVYNYDGKILDFGTVAPNVKAPEIVGGTATTEYTNTYSPTYSYVGNEYLEVEETNVTVKVGKTRQLHIQSNVSEYRTITSSNTSKATVSSTGEIYGVDVGRAMIIIRGTATGMVKKVNVNVVDPSDGAVSISIGNEEVEVTEDNVSQYYGSIVTNYRTPQIATWRLFFIDFNGDYAEPGTIFLKADQTSTNKLNVSQTPSEETIELMKKLNKEWAKNDGVVDNTNEIVAAYLCNEDNWRDSFKDSSKAEYVIGAPSVEMFINSYNQFHTNNETEEFQPINYAWDSVNVSGYKYSVGADNESYIDVTANNSLKTDVNSLYLNGTQAWWLASPAAGGNKMLCAVGTSNKVMGRGTMNSQNYGICPVVALKQDFIPILDGSLFDYCKENGLTVNDVGFVEIAKSNCEQYSYNTSGIGGGHSSGQKNWSYTVKLDCNTLMEYKSINKLILGISQYADGSSNCSGTITINYADGTSEEKAITSVTKNTATVKKEFEIDNSEKKIDNIEIYFRGFDDHYYSSSMYLRYVYIE